MYGLVTAAFCLLLGYSIAHQDWMAVFWVPLGFVFGLVATSQIVLPIVMGVPRAIRLVSKGEMRPAVFGWIALAPSIWLFSLAAVGFFLPAIAEYLCRNVPLVLVANLGMIAIILSPFLKKSRADFQGDFEDAYGRFYTPEGRSKRSRQGEAVIKVASNLYLHTIPEADDPVTTAKLQFDLADSRLRYMIFCMSALMKATELEIEKNWLVPVFEEALDAITTLASTENAQELFRGSVSPVAERKDSRAYLKWLLSVWSKYSEHEKADRHMEAIAMICVMIHSAESNTSGGEAEGERLGKLGLEIACLLSTMRDAFIALAGH